MIQLAARNAAAIRRAKKAELQSIEKLLFLIPLYRLELESSAGSVSEKEVL